VNPAGAVDAIVVASFGGPEGPEDVMPFLENVTRGRNVPPERLLDVAEHYYALGGVSPINGQNRDLIAALERLMSEAPEPALPVFFGNRNWAPFLADTVKDMAEAGVRHAAAYVTSAYAGFSSCRQYRDDIDRARASVGEAAPRITKVRHFFDHPGFVEPLAGLCRDALLRLPEGVRQEAHVVFTAHSVPVAAADLAGPQGGAYVAQLAETARLVAQRVGGEHPYRLVWQSRSGPPTQRWLVPDVNDYLGEVADSGATAVVVAPIGFVSDHVEVVHDLDQSARETAERFGLAFARAETVGTAPQFVAMIRELVREIDDPTLDQSGLGDPALRWSQCPRVCCGAVA
jgi:ferrochelatase